MINPSIGSCIQIRWALPSRMATFKREPEIWQDS